MISVQKKIYDIFSHPDFKLLFVNFTNFGIFQLVYYIVPLVTIPYIVRVIGPEKFGVVSLAQALVYYFSVIAEYGYGISGVQYIAQHQNDNLKCSEVVKNIFIIQFILMVLCYIILISIIELYSPFTVYRNIFHYSFLIVPANILLALWFYLGMEKVKYINYVTFTSRIFYIIAIFIFIRKMEDYYLIPILNSLSYILAALYSLFLMVKKFRIRFNANVPVKVIDYLKRDKSIFISHFFMNLYRNSNILILGLIASEAAVGFYSAGEKIIKAIQGTFTPITQVLYPYVSRIKVTSIGRSIKIIKNLTIIIACCGAAISLLIVLFSKKITLLAFGPDFLTTSKIISISSGVVFFGVINYVIGIIYMTNYSLKREFAKSVIITGIMNIISCSLLSYLWDEIGTAISFASTELILLLVMSYYIYKNKRSWTTNSAY